MFWTRIILGLVEFGLSLGLSIFIVYWSYKSFVRVNRERFDAQQEIYKGNVAVAILMAGLMYAASLILQESIYPVVSIVTLGFTCGGEEGGRSILSLVAYGLGHLVLGFFLAVGCVQVALKAFELLNAGLDEGKEIGKGNVAVAVLMASVVIIIALFMQQGVSTLEKSLIPQPTIGNTLRVME
ncbi:MAG: DUF350 domain-containing protein [Elusimicrobiota bacterium]